MSFIFKIIVSILSGLTRHFPSLLVIKLNAIRIIMQYVFRYRRKVITTNLKMAFPEYNGKKIRLMSDKYYRVLFRYILESLQLFFLDQEILLSGIKNETDHSNKSLLNGSESVILMGTHFGNWELVCLLPLLYPKQKFIAFYKPLSNPLIDQLMMQGRKRFGLEVFPIEQTARVIAQRKSENVAYIFVADQTPLNMNNLYWNSFLGLQTPWMTGGEKTAAKYGYNVLFLNTEPGIESMRIPVYSISIQSICVYPNTMQKGEITEIYTRLLESLIRHKPEYWLWSHRRWKRAHLYKNQ